MRLSIESGQRSAQQMATASNVLYQSAQRVFGRFIDPYLGDAPKALGLAHLTYVNPKLEVAPTPSKDRRRGFMFTTINMANTAGVAWEQLDSPNVCAYVWGRDINADSKSLYSANQSVFPTVNSDFWRCAYLKHILGDMAFDSVWSIRNTAQPTVYDSLLYAVNGLSRSLPGWPVIQLRHQVLVGCAYVFEMAKRGGGLNSSGYGLEPVLTKNNYEQVYA